MEWGEEEIALEIHCDAGQILTKAGNRAQIGICGFCEIEKEMLLMNRNFSQW